MPFDGVATAYIAEDLNKKLSDGRVEKALQPEKDEIILVIRARGENQRLLLSASANCARMHITSRQKENPDIPPVFCMLLRKHIVGGKISEFKCLDFDRIIQIKFLTTNDFGESCEKYIVIEIMGRHSNIILLNEDKKIIDSIKRVDFDMSSIREVLPGRTYILPPAQDKISPSLLISEPSYLEKLFDLSYCDDISISQIKEMRTDKYFLEKIKGFSPMLAREVCETAGVDTKLRCNETLLGENKDSYIFSLKNALLKLIKKLCIFRESTSFVFFKDPELTQPMDFYFADLYQYPYKRDFSDFSKTLDFFYSQKDDIERLRQKKSDTLRIITNNIDRCLKKAGIQEAAIKESEEKDRYKLFGELITANIYRIKDGDTSLKAINYYSDNNEEIEIKLDPQKSAVRNSQDYYKKYNKAKSTYINATKQLEESKEELKYLESVMQSLEAASEPQEISDIREELTGGGYIKAKGKSQKKKNKELSSHRIFKLSDGSEIWVGKNNIQNDEITLKKASNSDYWFHTKNIPGSHVILKTKGAPVSNIAITEAAQAAAYYSKACDSENVPVDYTLVKHVSKPAGAKPGMVAYENQKTLYVSPEKPIE